MHTAKHCMTDEEKSLLYQNIATAAESGYDFSTRWFEDFKNLNTIQAIDLIPIDLNAILYKTEGILSHFHSLKGNQTYADKFRLYSYRRRSMINDLMWSKEKNYWSDFNIKTKSLNDKNFYFSNLSPLTMGIQHPSVNLKDFILNINCLFNGSLSGVPFSFIKSAQQWDFPNVWAPNQHHLIWFLLKHDPSLALKIARSFFSAVYKGWLKTGLIYEKYNGLTFGERGFGGEYIVQTGFGWTNGVILTFINTFKDDLLVSI
jgi:alpha,alpha-trehalase